MEAFGNISDQLFKDIIQEALKRCRFFPKIADIEEIYKERMQSAALDYKQQSEREKTLKITEMPSYKSDLDIKKGKEEIGKLIAGSYKKMPEVSEQDIEFEGLK